MTLKVLDGSQGHTKPLGTPSISREWQVLGPFQIGTREAAWGADPLEACGGFRSLAHDAEATFPSSLCKDGVAHWSVQTAAEDLAEGRAVETSVVVSFPDVEWETLRGYYGWAALQYQAWARTEFTITGSGQQTIMVYPDGILELCIDKHRSFGGDVYSFRRAPLIMQVDPGQHRLDVRLIRDLRAMGGTGAPTLPFKVKIQTVPETFLVDRDHVLVPEMVRGRGLASHFASVPVHNTSTATVHIRGLQAADEYSQVELIQESGMDVAGGQSRSIAFRLESNPPNNLPTVSFKVVYTIGGNVNVHETVVTIALQVKSIEEPHKYTFLSPGLDVSYAILKIPTAKRGGSKAPVLLNLHGAGLEADSDVVRQMLDSVDDLAAFTVFPTGSTSWSGDDWHTWGIANVDAAVKALPDWAKAISWEGDPIDLDRTFIVGHSNGGQGTWFALTHQPDRFKGAGPVSGYSSIQAYVPYVFWREMDPALWRVLQSSLVSYKHELLVDNISHITPIEQQHGDADDNVPTYHSRRLHELLHSSGGQSRYTELPGKGHWFDGIMTTPALRKLYKQLGDQAQVERIPVRFRTIVPNSGDMYSRAGIFVDQLQSPDLLGSINAELKPDASIWTLTMSNIRRFHLSNKSFNGHFPSRINIDGSELDCRTSDDLHPCWYVKQLESEDWKLCDDSSWKSINQRYGAQIGPLDSFLRTRSRFTIQSVDAETRRLALQVAQNLYQYFSADCQLSDQGVRTSPISGNRIVLSLGDSAPGLDGWFPIHTSGQGVSIADSKGNLHRYPSAEGLGAIYLSPLPDEALQLNIWGYDSNGLAQAARLVPMQTGVGQPDFVIVTSRCAFEGAAGVLASGFLDHSWKVSQGSFIR